jgi:hypothetical protein
MHWRVKHRARQQYAAAIYALQMAGQLPKIPWPAYPKATVRASLVLGAAMDDDNAVARCKWPLDILVELGYLADDRRKCLRWESFPEQTVSRKLEPSLTLVLTPVL